jgi:AcrR family transcriptional regulator
MAAPNRQAQRSNRSSEALLDAAAELISEGGLGSMTFAAIGERAGYSRGLVTARFGSKAGLVDALIRRVWGQLHDAHAVPLSHGGRGLDELIELIEAIRDQSDEHPRDVGALLALMFEALADEPELRARMADFHASMREDIADALRRGIDDGSVADHVDPESGALMIVAIMRGFSYQWLLDRESIDLHQAYGELIHLIHDLYGA